MRSEFVVNVNVAGLPGLLLYGGYPADELVDGTCCSGAIPFGALLRSPMRSVLVVTCCRLQLSYILRLTVSGLRIIVIVVVTGY